MYVPALSPNGSCTAVRAHVAALACMRTSEYPTLVMSLTARRSRTLRTSCPYLALSAGPSVGPVCSPTVLRMKVCTVSVTRPYTEIAMGRKVPSPDLNAFVMLGGVRVPPQSYERAAELYGQAAAQGRASAQACLGELYRDGKGVPQDTARAVALFKAAAAGGSEAAAAVLRELGEAAPTGAPPVTAAPQPMD